MIELYPTTALMLYLCVTLAVLFGIWGYQHYTGRNKKVITSEKKLQVCEYCHFAYLADIGKNVSQCPQCQSFNKI